jgi:NADPH:quinone reductase-like Zn-dependent oxidoreductase
VQAFVLEQAGAQPVLQGFGEPSPDGENVTAHVLMAGLNPVDLKQAKDPVQPSPLPRVVGNEAVVDLGGRTYYAERTVAPYGSLAERCLIQRHLAIELPPELDPAAALGVGIAGLAGWVALETAGQLQPGETVIVLGATGAVGQVAVQTARLLGAGRVVAAGRDAATLSRLDELGADATVLLDGEADGAVMLEASQGGADLVLDMLFGAPLAAALQAVRTGGRIVSVGSSAATNVTIPYAAIRGRSLINYTNQLTEPSVKRAAFEQMITHLEAGDLSVSSEVVPLERVQDAWQRQATSPHTKIVVQP